MLHIDVPISGEFNLDSWPRSLLAEAKFTFLFASSSDSDDPNTVSLSILDYTVAIFFALIKIFRQVHGYYGELFMICSILTLWMRSYVFYKAVKICNEKLLARKPIDKFKDLYREYAALKQFSSLVNQVVSFMMMLYIIISILYFSSNLDGLIISSNFIYKIRALSFHIHSFIIYFIAADIPYRVKAFTEWISDLSLEQLNLFPSPGVAVVLHDVSEQRVGITGNNLVTITYTFLANVLKNLTYCFLIISYIFDIYKNL